MNFQRKALWVSLAAAALLAGCGGGGADTTPLAPIRGVKVVGDSLADSGTFGYKFTVQGTAPTGTGATALWVDRVAASYSQTLCARYASTDGVRHFIKAGKPVPADWTLAEPVQRLNARPEVLAAQDDSEPPSKPADRIMPSLVPKRILRGARLAMNTTLRPTSFSGSP